jgi:hypothetical protein
MTPTVEQLEARCLFSSFWVSPSGSDSSPGTSVAPFKTIQHAADLVKAGDTVTVRAGTYAGFAKYGLKGTASQPISFVAEPGVSITTKAPAETALDCGIEMSGFDSGSGCAYVNLSGFTVSGIGSKTSAGQGIRVRFSNHVTIANCTTVDNGWVGEYFAYVSYVSISACVSSNNNGFVDSGTARNHGIYVANSSDHVSIVGCTVAGNNGNGIHLNGDGGVNTGFTIGGNTIFGNGANGGSGVNCDGLTNSVIEGNYVVNNLAKGVSIYSIDGGNSTGNVVKDNLIIQSNGRPALQFNTSGNTATGNVLVNWSTEAIENNATNTITGNVYYGTLIGASGAKQTCKTLRGDTNFDGKLTADDYVAIDSNLATADPIGIAVADLNLDGSVTPDDYVVLDSSL